MNDPTIANNNDCPPFDYDEHDTNLLKEQYGVHQYVFDDMSRTSHDTPVPPFALHGKGSRAGDDDTRTPQRGTTNTPINGNVFGSIVTSTIQSIQRVIRSNDDRDRQVPFPLRGQNDEFLQPQGGTTSCGSKFRHWLVGSAWPGLGLFGESYLLFSIGTLKPIWEELFPQCFATDRNDDEEEEGQGDGCPDGLVHSLTYSVVLGVILGMVLLGYIANIVGRRRGSLLTASLMSGGAIAMSLVSVLIESKEISPEDDRIVSRWFRFLSVALFVFGVGVGGEYPLSAASASEKAAGQYEPVQQKQQEQQPEVKMNTPFDSADSGGMGVLENSKRTSLLAVETKQEFISPELSLAETDRTHQEWDRGRQVQLVFSMQGMGVWFNSLVLLLLLTLTGQTGGVYDADALILIWRVTYWIGAIVLCFVLVTRYLYLKESTVWAYDKEQRQRKELEMDALIQSTYDRDNQATGSNQSTRLGGTNEEISESWHAEGQETSPTLNETNSGISDLSNPPIAIPPSFEYGEPTFRPNPPSDPIDNNFRGTVTQLLWQNFGARLLGASMSWLLWDISFYGNKLFQSTFILALTGEETTLMEFGMASTLNATVALLGYFGAAALIDRPEIGRVKLQAVGFLVTGSLFVACGFCYDRLPSNWLVALYLASSFTGQLGPNATTFLIPAEIFPTDQRTLCHGICAASGKVGALIAAILFHYIKRDSDLFLFCGFASFAACLITIWSIPETTGLDLLEIDKKWRMTIEGRKDDYRGPANDSHYLSFYERFSNKRRKNLATPCNET
jgi:MFS family permease